MSIRTFPTPDTAKIIVSVLLIGIFMPVSGRTASPDDFVRPFVAVDTTDRGESYPILNPLPDGPIRVLFIGEAHRVAPVAFEVMARLDCTVESVLTATHQALGISGDREDSTPVSLLTPSVFLRLQTLLDDSWDIIWLDFDLKSLPGGLDEAILAHVSRGTGLVVTGDREQFRNIATDRSADTQFPNMISYRTIQTISAMKRGVGLILVFPPLPDETSARERGDWFNGAAACVYEAARRRSSFSVNGLQVARKPVEQESVGIMRFRLEYNSTEEDPLTVIIRCRNQDGMVVKQSSETRDIDRGKGVLSFSYPAVPVGSYSLDVTGIQNGRVVFFSGTTFEVETDERIEQVRFWYPTAPRGGFVMGTVSMRMAFREGMYITIEIIDDKGNVLNRVVPSIVPLRKSVDFTMKLQDDFPRAVTVVVSFYKNNECVETVKKPYIVSESETPGGFLLGVYDNGSKSGMKTHEVYRMLGEAGVSLAGQKVYADDETGDVFSRALVPSAAGLRVMTDLIGPSDTGTLPPEEQDRLVAALLDTLRAFDPAFIATANNGYVQHIRTILPETPSALFIPPDKVLPGPTGMPSLSETPRELYIASDPILPETVEIVQEGVDPEKSIESDNPRFGLVIPDTWKSPDSERLLSAIPWWSLFSGFSQIWWYPLTGDWKAAVTPQGSLSPSFAVVAREAHTIKQGIGSLFLNGHPDNGAVSIALTDEAGEPVPSVMSTVRNDGSLTYIGVALDPSAGKTVTPDTVRMHILRTGSPEFLYNVLAGTFVGAIDTVTCSLDRGGGFYALLPYRVQRISLAVEPIIQPGDPISFTASVELVETVSPGNHLLSVSIERDDGRTLTTKTVTARDGVCSETIHIHGLMSGSVRLVVYDLISGKSVERTIFIRPGSDEINQGD